MSQRVKKPCRTEDNPGKRRRRRLTGSDGDEDGARSGSNSGGNGSQSGMWTPRHLNDLKVSSIYNRNSAEAPAELYRKDLISAMKLPDSEPLTPEDYWLITDPWKQEWEKGVQVPVNPQFLPEPEVIVITPVAERSHDFRLPKKKYIRVTHDDFFNPDYHQLVSTAARAEKVCSYDLDDVDAAWLGCANSDRVMQSQSMISEFLMEQVIEELELQCWEQVQTILKSQEGLGIEYDENVICDVCRSPESEEGNEMVFCDSCNICVHQACYGITTIPSGSWLCHTCKLEIKPSCVLCPNVGGAMKATRSGNKWAHVACAIWIPEVSIGSVEKMEPITKISVIPQSRWSLICVLCKEKTGACIQCSVKTCKTAYHVTCAFKKGLEMKPIIVDENAEDGIKLRSYCEKHSINTKKDKASTYIHSGSEDETEKKKTRTMTAEERSQARAEKLQQIESEFFKYVRLKDVSSNLAVDMDIVNLLYNYWKLKRKSLNNRPLVPPRPETTQLLTQQQEQDLEQMKMFVQLRQDLERVRNLCYMVSRREKLSRSYFRLREQTFQKQAEILSESCTIEKIREEQYSSIVEANHGPSVYDKLYSFHDPARSKYPEVSSYENLVSMISEGKLRPNGIIQSTKPTIKLKPVNGKVTKTKPTKAVTKKSFVNGARRRCNMKGSSESEIDLKTNLTDCSVPNSKKKGKVKVTNSKSASKSLSYLFGDSDSSANDCESKKVKGTRTKSKNASGALKQMEKSLQLSSESDDLDFPTGDKSKSNMPIYSDSEEDLFGMGNIKSGEIPIHAAHNRNKPKTKAPTKRRARKKTPSFDPAELIVPQREAAKKATESLRNVKKNGANSINASNKGEVGQSDDAKSITPLMEDEKKQPVEDEEAANTILKGAIVQQSTRKKGVKGRKPNALRAKANSELDEGKETDDTKEITDVVENDNGEEECIDMKGNGGNPPSYVPQRKAAKKAAEHIRSGLSNIVAARLIIEDEMEASRKRGKNVKDKPAVEKLGALPPQKTAGKTSKEILRKTLNALEGSNNARRKGKVNTDWPFLDKGSQSKCERSREDERDAPSARGRAQTNGNEVTSRNTEDPSKQSSINGKHESNSSTSSSCSSTSSSSCSSSSSGSSCSSRSSSPEPASPKRDNSLDNGGASASVSSNSPRKDLFMCTRTEQEWNSYLHWSPPSSSKKPCSTPTAQRTKSPSKSGGPQQIRGRRSPSRKSANSRRESQPSPSLQPEKPATGTESASSLFDKSVASDEKSSNAARRASSSPVITSPKAQEKESSTAAEKKKNSNISAAHALVATLESNKGPNLSSPSSSSSSSSSNSSESSSSSSSGEDSDHENSNPNIKEDTQVPAGNIAPKVEKTAQLDVEVEPLHQIKQESTPEKISSPCISASPASKWKPLQPATDVVFPAKNTVDHEVSPIKTTVESSPNAASNNIMSSRKRKESSVISDSQDFEEKENSCKATPTVLNSSSPVRPADNSQIKGRSNYSAGVNSSAVLSPLPPSMVQDNIEPTLVMTSANLNHNYTDITTTSVALSSPQFQSKRMKHNDTPLGMGLFSPPPPTPPPAPKESQVAADHSVTQSDIQDLYDFASKVAAANDNDDDKNDIENAPLSFSFPSGILAQEDNKEDSALATLNLVQKLRSTIQQGRKLSGSSRTSSPPPKEDIGGKDEGDEESKTNPVTPTPELDVKPYSAAKIAEEQSNLVPSAEPSPSGELNDHAGVCNPSNAVPQMISPVAAPAAVTDSRRRDSSSSNKSHHHMSLEEKINELHRAKNSSVSSGSNLNKDPFSTERTTCAGSTSPPSATSVASSIISSKSQEPRDSVKPISSTSVIRPPPQSTVAQIIESVVNNHQPQVPIMKDLPLAPNVSGSHLRTPMGNVASSNVPLQAQPSGPNVTMATATALSILQGLTNGPAPTSVTKAPSRLSDDSNLKSSPIGATTSAGFGTNTINSKVNTTAPQFPSMTNWEVTSKEARIPLTRDEIMEQVAPSLGQNIQQQIPKVSNKNNAGATGKRATAPRTAATKANEKIKTTEEAETVSNSGGGKGKAKPENKNKTSPRGRRGGGGRGRFKTKGFAGPVRKDLAGTVYDIDFDEFEENNEEKFEEFKMLRERRKSSSCNDQQMNNSSITQQASSPHAEWNNLVLHVSNSPHTPRARSMNKSLTEEKVLTPNRIAQTLDQKSTSGLSPAPQGSQPKLTNVMQTHLPGAVDMRTYNASVLTPHNQIDHFNVTTPTTGAKSIPTISPVSIGTFSDVMNSLDCVHPNTSLQHANGMHSNCHDNAVLPHLGSMPSESHSRTGSSANQSIVKDTGGSDMAALLLASVSNSTLPAMADLDELDNALEALASSAPIPSQTGTSSLDPVNPTYPSSHPSITKSIISPHTITDTSHSQLPSINKDSSANLPRNQLKVKIKGPFLDANYCASASSNASVAPTPAPAFSSMGGTSVGNSMFHSYHQDMNSSNSLRRMRKKELLRQYCAQDMNSSDASFGTFYDTSSNSNPPFQYPHNPHPHYNRTVITIPKAVASMTIIPTKDDYNQDINGDSPPFDDSLESMNFAHGASVPTPATIEPPPSKKKRRMRGVSREIAALGITTEQLQGRMHRRRERGGGNNGNGARGSDSSGSRDELSSSRKRGRGSKQQDSVKGSRSTFIPPSLEHSMSKDTTPAMVTPVTTTVSHPTPKLKIKFGDNKMVTCKPNPPSFTSVNGEADTKSSISISELEKEVPSKKARGRPPKKRGIEVPFCSTPNSHNISSSNGCNSGNDSASGLPLVGEPNGDSNDNGGASPNAMEKLKRLSMQFRERVMQEFVVEEKRKKDKGSRKTKKNRHKNKEASSKSSKLQVQIGSEDVKPDLSSKMAQVKVIEGGAKRLILKFGKLKESSESRQKVDTASDVNPLVALESDSGFTGSSEGSNNSGDNGVNNLSDNSAKAESAVAKRSPSGFERGNDECKRHLEGDTKSGTQSSVENNGSGRSGGSGGLMPIRLKLSRCYEGYSLQKDNEDSVVVEKSSSCEVR